MEKVIACCGINCATCDARTATLNNDNELRVKTAAAWSAQFNASITPEMINCTGCREEGVKFGHCNDCEIRKCVKAQDFRTCGDCEKLGSCETVGNLLKYVPDAMENLKSLN